MVRKDWMAIDGVVPKTRVSAVFVLKSIARRCGKEWCTITAAPAYAPMILEWTQRMQERGVHVPWKGEGIGALGLRCIEEMLKPKRQPPPEELKHAIR